MGETRDYLDWHDAYERPGSSLQRRLEVVIDLIRRSFDEVPPGPVRVISLCAGQGADLLGAADGHARAADLVGRLVELDPRNVARARTRVAAMGLGALEVVEGDAGVSDAYAGATPADLVLACGIFGNISDADIERTIRFLPSLCARQAFVVWTRHPRDAELLDRVRHWFEDAGLASITTVVADDRTYAAGLNRLAVDPPVFEPGKHLFTFIQ